MFSRVFCGSTTVTISTESAFVVPNVKGANDGRR